MDSYALRRGPLADLQEILSFKLALKELVKRDLKVRYKRSSLGVVWTVLTPLIMAAITTVVFSHLFRFDIENFPLYVLSGTIVWGFFAQATGSANTSILAGSGLLRKMYLPPALFPLAAVNGAAVNLAIGMVPLAALMLISGAHLSWALLFVPVAMLLLLLFTLGLALLLAALAVFFHDIVPMYQVVLQGWLYLTPIFYPREILPESLRFVIALNPMYHLLKIFRDPIYAGVWPDPINVAVAALYAVGTTALGWYYFERSRDVFSAYV